MTRLPPGGQALAIVQPKALTSRASLSLLSTRIQTENESKSCLYSIGRFKSHASVRTIFPFVSITSRSPRTFSWAPCDMTELERDWRVRLHVPSHDTSWESKSRIRRTNRQRTRQRRTIRIWPQKHKLKLTGRMRRKVQGLRPRRAKPDPA